MSHATPRRGGGAEAIDPSPDVNQLADLEQFLESHEQRAMIITAGGDEVRLPLAAYELLRQGIRVMNRGGSVGVHAADGWLTTQEAADILGVSRNTIVRVLDRGELPYEQAGRSKHRRIRRSDLLAYQQTARRERRAILDELTREGVEQGLYAAEADDYREALRAARKGS